MGDLLERLRYKLKYGMPDNFAPREFLNKYGYYVAGGILLLAIITYFVVRPSRSVSGFSGDPSMGFFVDEETGATSVHPVRELPPLMGKAGRPTVVRAMKYSFDGGSTSEVVYLVKYTPEAKEALDAMAPDDPARQDILAKGMLVRAPTGSTWYPFNSTEGSELMALRLPVHGKTIMMVSPR